MKNNIIKTVISVLLLLSTLCLGACNTPKETGTTKGTDTTLPSPPPIPNPIGEEISIPAELTAYYPQDLILFVLNAEHTLEEFASRFPSSYTKQLDSTHKCLTYKVYRGEGVRYKEMYVYVLFKFMPETGVWVNTNSEYYVLEKLYSSEDFSFLEEGLGVEYFEFDYASGEDLPFRLTESHVDYYYSKVCKLLSDGVLVINFSAMYDFSGSGAGVPINWLKVTDYYFYPYGSTDAPDYISVINYPNLLQEN